MGIDNLEIAINNHTNNDYLLNNSQYRNQIKAKLGGGNSISPTFIGGGLHNNIFLLNEI
jgi:hypothetical protein